MRPLAAILVVLLAPAASWANGFGPHPAKPTSGFGHVDRSGLTEHVVRGFFQGVLSGGLIGFALGGSDETRRIRVGTGMVLGAAAGTALPLLLNKDRTEEVRSGDVAFINVAQNWVLANGFLIPLAFQINAKEARLEDVFDDDADHVTIDELRLDAGLAAALSLGAGVAAAAASSALNFSPGQADAIGSAGLWGAFTGAMLVVMAAPDDPASGWGALGIASALTLGNLGALSAWYVRDDLDIDRRRVRWIDIGGLVGAGVGVALGYFLNPDFDNNAVIGGSVLAGGLAGAVGGYLLTDWMNGFHKGAPPPMAARRTGAGPALLRFDGREWDVGLPLPRPSPTAVERRRTPRTVLSLVDGRF